ncbi:M20 family metallopeptidase [Neomoorella thermoacetica]|uniref:Peptidase M20D, amidohydrolase n=1 Tax=Moorella thermoacetica (strain ATCC 39073 / JCM 9320) TaxID=264732 RepID=Q2RH29_MOOTA|nr:M20 family metallopeptidase [Moorella thermoacetica]AKX94784.1 putative hydrolase YxeP [Moorella thermoacetica]AKX97416.1 putative hydrolase YxeP [Moorella thermoacetica]OIQ54662.1 putative hydrolase YxeP [Moorella thermoacetica]OIQ57165.1 putative hydrolase YxeP [Moorella thermoacetica]OIQ62695.1 putative hydrolase YxeP [Moorella thermoacetica]
MVSAGDLRAAAEALKPQLVAWRRRLHQYPELSFEERETSAMVAGVLRELGLQVRSGIGGTGVVGVLAGAGEGPGVALRADMDALPLQEDTGEEFASRYPGRMHGCGHDAHMTMVLGAATILAERRQELPGPVVFIFQPGEELPPGGASRMLAAGVLDDPPVKAAFGLHVTAYLPVGTVGVRSGAIMASADNFTIKIKGRTSHGASPHLGADAIVAAAQAVLALQTIISRHLDPVQPAVLTVGTIKGGEKENIVAGEVTLTGTTRALNNVMRQQLEKDMRQVLAGVAAASGTEIDLDYLWGYPPLVNNAGLTELFRRVAGEILGPDKVLELANPSMGAEDFARYAEKVPAVYFNLGAAIPGAEPHPWHHPRFNINEDCLPIGAGLLAALAVRTLEDF